MKNICFIDGQNLHFGTQSEGWHIDHAAFRVYLRDKYNVQDAYYFLGYVVEEENPLYRNLQRAGFIVLFKDHPALATSKKKGNVDTDIVFEVMRSLLDDAKDFDKIVLVSGDGDYKKLVDYLIGKGRFEKILFPGRKNYSSLYKTLGNKHYAFLDAVRTKIEHARDKLPM